MIPGLNDERLQELSEGQGFRFACHPGVPCFNQCCRQLTLWLTPYDALRLKRRLGLTSQEFIERYANVETGQNGWPMPMLAMREDDPERTCPFLGQGGCTVYEDRPGACRTYPLGRATKGGTGGGPSQEAFFLVREDHCQGFAAGPEWTPSQWMQDQGLETYNHVNDLFLPIITRQAPDPDPQIIARKMQMFLMACYDLESFRKFINTSRFRDLFAIPALRLELAETNDLELLKLAFDWLRFAIF
ncbi:MAG: YkgJ family cysteine cluster protein, partial [Desulfarculus sp.]|nr:YkgJ family cysteine cluster protein [Desulfarculus sp.]